LQAVFRPSSAIIDGSLWRINLAAARNFNRRGIKPADAAGCFS
jgi:hypothetical protein